MMNVEIKNLVEEGTNDAPIFDNGESVTHLYAVQADGNLNEEQVKEIIEHYFPETHNHYDYSPTGLWFRRRGRVRAVGYDKYTEKTTLFIEHSAFLDC